MLELARNELREIIAKGRNQIPKVMAKSVVRLEKGRVPEGTNHIQGQRPEPEKWDIIEVQGLDEPVDTERNVYRLVEIGECGGEEDTPFGFHTACTQATSKCPSPHRRDRNG